MAPAATSVQFLEIVRKSDLVATEMLDEFLKGLDPLPGAGTKLAKALIQAGLVTRYQAEQLLKGRYRGFDLGKYRILEPIGGGAMGMVYLCEHRAMRKRVAVKLLSRQVLEKDPTALARFLREARAAAALNHPNIVRTHDVDQANGYHYLVMEYVDGCTLTEVVAKSGPLPPAEAAHYATQAALGLQHVHAHGLVHRDLKPGNLLRDKDGTVKILDLGLALFTQDQNENLTEAGGNATILGTASYLAPEQAVRSHTVDARADLYSLGATLYFLLAGEAPFSNLPATHKLIALHAGKPKPLPEYRDDLDPALVQVVEKLMAKDAADRFPTALEAAHALAPFTASALELPSLPEPGARPVPLINEAALDTETIRSSARTQPGSSFTGMKIKSPSSHGSGRIVPAPADPPLEPKTAHAMRWLKQHPRTTAGSAAGVLVLLLLSVFVFPRASAPQAAATVVPVRVAAAPVLPIASPTVPDLIPTPAVPAVRPAPVSPAPEVRRDPDVIHYLDFTQLPSFGIRLRGPTVMQRLGDRDWPAGWSGRVWHRDSFGELIVEPVNNAPALAIRNLQGQAAAELYTLLDRSPVVLLRKNRYVIRVEYLTNHPETKGRLDVRFADPNKTGRDQVEAPPTGSAWKTAQLAFEPPADAPLALYIANLATGRDKPFYVRSVEVRETVLPNTTEGAAGERTVLYRLDLKDSDPATVHCEGGRVLSQSGSLPRGWSADAWNPNTFASLAVDNVRGLPVLTVRNEKGPPSATLYLNDLPLRANRRYAVKVQYQLASAKGQVRFREDGTDTKQLGDLPASGTDWRNAEFILSAIKDGRARIEFTNLASDAEAPLLLRAVEVTDLGW